MKKFKEFLLSEDLGIGPEGTAKNPSLKNYIDSLEKERKELQKQYDNMESNPGERDRINDLLTTKKQELMNINLFNKQLTPKNIVNTPEVNFDNALNNEPVSLKQSAIEKLARPDTSVPSVSLGSEQGTSLSSGYSMTNRLSGASPALSNLRVDDLGKTSKTQKF